MEGSISPIEDTFIVARRGVNKDLLARGNRSRMGIPGSEDILYSWLDEVIAGMPSRSCDRRKEMFEVKSCHSEEGAMHPLIRFIPAVAVVATGLLGGVMLGVAMEQQTAQNLPADCWIVRQNLNDQLFRVVMPLAFVITNASACLAIFLLRGSARIWMVSTVVSSLVVVLITIAFEVPLNDLMAKWGPSQFPADWWLTRDAWLRNHWWRTLFGMLAFVFSITANLVQNR